MKKTKLSSDNEPYYAVLCTGGYALKNALIMGVFASKIEATEVMNREDLRLCPAKHVIKKCKVEVTF